MGRRWLDDRIKKEYLPVLSKLKNTPVGRRKATEMAAQMRKDWTERGMKTLLQQQGLMSDVRRAIKDELGDDHFSLEFITFSTAEYIEINNQRQGSVADRNESVTYIDNPDGIVAQAVRLLESPEWAEICAGLAVLTGRRVSELLSTAEFEPKTKWSVTFTGALKRRGETQTLSFEFPTLTTAEKVCKALETVRTELPQATKMTARQVNASYSGAVAKACDEKFAHLVPKRSGKDNLYTHLFRAVYATIALFWYCPPNVVDWEFKAAIQGHFQVLDAENPELRRELTSSRHYSDYEIADHVIAQHGGKRKGIKLGIAGVQPIEMFRERAETYTPPVPTASRKITSLRYYADQHDRWLTILETLCPDCHNQAQRTERLLEWIEQRMQYQELAPAAIEEIAVELEIEEKAAIESLHVEAEPEPIEVKPVELAQSVAAPSDPMMMMMERMITATEQIAQLSKPMAELTTMLSQQPVPSVATPHSSTPATFLPPGREGETQRGTPRLRKTSGTTSDTINRAIDAIMAYNNNPDRLHDEKWAITINALKGYAQSQHTIMRILKEREQEINEHHTKHQLDVAKHNHRHKRKNKITDVIIVV